MNESQVITPVSVSSTDWLDPSAAPGGNSLAGARQTFATIVADPPWEVGRGPEWSSNGSSRPLEYPTMTKYEIAALPVRSMAAKGAHLYLWTINAYVEDAYWIARAWGFEPSTLLTWGKPRHGIGLGGTFTITPRSSGRIKIDVRGYFSNSANASTRLNVSYGTGTAPSFGDAQSGTLLNTQDQLNANNTAATTHGFSVYGEVASLAIGTAVWVDPVLKSVSGAGNSTMVVTSVLVEEIPA